MTAVVPVFNPRAEPRRAVKRGYPRGAGSVRLCRTLAAVERLLYQRLVDAVVLDVKTAPTTALALPARFPRIPMFVLSALRSDDGPLLAACDAAGGAGGPGAGGGNAVAGGGVGGGAGGGRGQRGGGGGDRGRDGAGGAARSAGRCAQVAPPHRSAAARRVGGGASPRRLPDTDGPCGGGAACYTGAPVARVRRRRRPQPEAGHRSR